MSYLDGSLYGPGAIDDDGYDWTDFLDAREAGYGLGGPEVGGDVGEPEIGS